MTETYNKTRIAIIAILMVSMLACSMPGGDVATPIPEIDTDSSSQGEGISVPPTPEIIPQTQDPPEGSIPEAPPTEPPLSVEPDVSYDGVSFIYDHSLAGSVVPSLIPLSIGADQPEWDQNPETIRFDFEEYIIGQAFHSPVIEIFSPAEYAEITQYSNEEVGLLISLLENRPLHVEDRMPFLPIWNAGQVLGAKIHYIDFPGGSGAAYLTMFAQDITPVYNEALIYTFQGLMFDRSHYISARFPVSHQSLPDTYEVDDYNTLAENYPAYIEDTRNHLNGLDPGSFTPSLILLDDMMGSITID